MRNINIFPNIKTAKEDKSLKAFFSELSTKIYIFIKKEKFFLRIGKKYIHKKNK